MRRILDRRPSPSIVVAMAALSVSLGGSAYAAGLINGKNIKNRSISAKKLQRSTLTGQEVKDGSLVAGDFALGQLPRGAAGPHGPAGPAGATGPQGPAGPAGSIASAPPAAI